MDQTLKFSLNSFSGYFSLDNNVASKTFKCFAHLLQSIKRPIRLLEKNYVISKVWLTNEMAFVNHIKIKYRLWFKLSFNLLISRYLFFTRSPLISSFSISLSFTVLETLFFQPLTQCNIFYQHTSQHSFLWKLLRNCVRRNSKAFPPNHRRLQSLFGSL